MSLSWLTALSRDRRLTRSAIGFGIPPKKRPLLWSKDAINRAWNTSLLVLKASTLASILGLAGYSVFASRAYVIDRIDVPAQTGFEREGDFRNAVLEAMEGVSDDLTLVQAPKSEQAPVSVPQPLVDFKIPETGLTVQYLIERLQTIRGNAPVHISVSVRYRSRGLAASADREKLVIETQVDSRHIPPVNVDAASQDALIHEVVKQILRQTNPYAYGMYLLNERETDDAVAVYNQMVAEGRDLKWTYLLRASIASWSNSPFPYEDMETYPRKALELDSEFVPAYDTLGFVYGMRGQKEQAIRMYEKAIALDPKNLTTRLHYGDSLTTLGDLVGAERELQKAIDLDPENPRGYEAMAGVIARRRGDYSQELVSFYDQAVAKTRNNPRLLARLGEAYHIANDDHRAASAYEAAIQAGSRVEDDYNWLLSYYSNHKDLYAAFNLYQKKNFLFPSEAGAYEYGLFLLRYSKYQDALDTLLKIPLSNHPDRYGAVGRAYLGLERFNEAIPYFEQADRLDQKNHAYLQTPTSYWELLAQAYSGAKRYTHAVRLYQQNMFKSGSTFGEIPSDYYTHYAEALRGAGRVRDAQAIEREQLRRFRESLKRTQGQSVPPFQPGMQP